MPSNLTSNFAPFYKPNLRKHSKCLNNIIALAHKWTPNSTITHSYQDYVMPNGFVASSYDNHAIWMWKGREHECQSILELVKSIDLSSNKLVGTILEKF